MISRTGIVILDVGMLSGFSLSPGAVPTGLIQKVERTPEKVSLYLDSVSASSHYHFVYFIYSFWNSMLCI